MGWLLVTCSGHISYPLYISVHISVYHTSKQTQTHKRVNTHHKENTITHLFCQMQSDPIDMHTIMGHDMHTTSSFFSSSTTRISRATHTWKSHTEVTDTISDTPEIHATRHKQFIHTHNLPHTHACHPFDIPCAHKTKCPSISPQICLSISTTIFTHTTTVHSLNFVRFLLQLLSPVRHFVLSICVCNPFNATVAILQSHPHSSR